MLKRLKTCELWYRYSNGCGEGLDDCMQYWQSSNNLTDHGRRETHRPCTFVFFLTPVSWLMALKKLQYSSRVLCRQLLSFENCRVVVEVGGRSKITNQKIKWLFRVSRKKKGWKFSLLKMKIEVEKSRKENEVFIVYLNKFPKLHIKKSCRIEITQQN